MPGRLLVALAVLLAVNLSAFSEQDKIPKRVASQIKTAENIRRRADQRLQAIERLGDEEHRAAVESLERCLSDSDKSIRRAAARELWTSPSPSLPLAIPALRRALKDPSPDVAVLAANALLRLDTPREQLVDAFREGLMANLATSRFYGARGLIGINPATQLMPILLESLDYRASRTSDAEEEMEAVLRLVEETQDRGVIYDLMGVVRSNPTITAQALVALSKFDPLPSDWGAVLGSKFHSDRPEIQMTAIELAGQAGGQAEDWVPEALPLLSTSDHRIRLALSRACEGAAGNAHGCAPALTRLLAEGEEDEQLQAAKALGAIGDNSQPLPREVLKQVAGQSSVPLENTVMGAASEEVMRASLSALIRLAIPPQELAATLARIALNHPSAAVSVEALRALGPYASDAGNIRRTLEDLSSSSNDEIRRLSKTILAQIP